MPRLITLLSTSDAEPLEASVINYDGTSVDELAALLRVPSVGMSEPCNFTFSYPGDRFTPIDVLPADGAALTLVYRHRYVVSVRGGETYLVTAATDMHILYAAVCSAAFLPVGRFYLYLEGKRLLANGSVWAAGIRTSGLCLRAIASVKFSSLHGDDVSYYNVEVGTDAVKIEEALALDGVHLKLVEFGAPRDGFSYIPCFLLPVFTRDGFLFSAKITQRTPLSRVREAAERFTGCSFAPTPGTARAGDSLQLERSGPRAH